MNDIRHLSVKSRRLLLGAFLFYLFGLLGFAGEAHHHDESASHGQSQQECQLCQISTQPYAAPVPMACPESPAAPTVLVEAVWHHVLSHRHLPFSSRAPPAV
ncbi:MAG: hypothetical protein M3Y08_07790 [Fibrobacterota bacterium]|nr:hypothetical protein [Fibrobacterota bacterium]